MNHQPDLVIRGGCVVDGAGSEPLDADVAIQGDRIVAIGEIAHRGTREIDARGMIVTPGFVDIHTHYDGQVTWEESLRPSTSHGVTTVVMGNCGVGFAPCKPQDRKTLINLMEGVEDIPEIVMTRGVPWEWRSFSQYLDYIERRTFDADVVALLPHAPVRVFVMGERAATGEPPTRDDLRAMTAIVAGAVRAGAIGVSTSRTIMHQGADGRPAPHVRSDRDEMAALALGLRNAGGGVFQLTPRLSDATLEPHAGSENNAGSPSFIAQELELLREMAEISGGPLTFSLVDIPGSPGLYRQVLETLTAMNGGDRRVTAQIFPRPVGLLIGLDVSINPFMFHPSYLAIRHLPLADRVATMKTPHMRSRLFAESADPIAAGRKGPMYITRALNGFRLGDPPDYTLDPSRSLLVEARSRGVEPAEVALEWLLEEEGRHIYMAPAVNFSSPDLESVWRMLTHRDTLVGLGDGGAHCGVICDAGYPTTLLSHWVRDRDGPMRLPLTSAVNFLSRRNALAFGLDDRGLIAPGMKADINVIDLANLRASPPRTVYDLPAGGRRITQAAQGYVATLVAGEITQLDGRPTGARPGRLVRGGQASTARCAAGTLRAN